MISKKTKSGVFEHNLPNEINIFLLRLHSLCCLVCKKYKIELNI